MLDDAGYCWMSSKMCWIVLDVQQHVHLVGKHVFRKKYVVSEKIEEIEDIEVSKLLKTRLTGCTFSVLLRNRHVST